MNGSRSRSGRDLPDSFPGYMGRMMNIFDLSTGMARTKLLTGRPHRDVTRSSDVVKKQIYPVVAEKEGKQIISEQRNSSSNKKSGGTPIKMLISQEMCRDTESRQKPSNVVAKLMGLDSLPGQQSVITDGKIRNNGILHNTSTGELQHYQQQEGDYVDKSMACKIRSFTYEKTDYRDVYEIQQQPSKSMRVDEQYPRKVICDENSYQRRMALVRQKFTEAKNLATDGKLLDSKEFKDAVEVLNSNRDLFLKFLEEPNSLLRKHLFENQSIFEPSQATHITVLKPSNKRERKGKKTIQRQLLTASDESVRKANKHYWHSGFSEPIGQNFSQPTRIVVLRPSSGKIYDTKTTLLNNSSRLLSGRSSSGSLATDELVGSREVAKGLTFQMRSPGSNRKDETLVSSVLSNGYNGDESSFYRSESEYIEDEFGSLSDSEFATPVTNYSWDYVNKIGSPFSASSVTQASHSPESSVNKEAKKRLSERLAVVASNVNSQDQRQIWRTSSTLGEMLAIPELKKEEENKRELTPLSSKPSNREDDLKVTSTFESTFGTKYDYNGENSHRKLSRSKSVPVSSSGCEVDELNVEVSNSLIAEPIVRKEVSKSNSRSSFKEKVSSFFFSTSKKPSRDKPSRSLSIPADRGQSRSSNGSGKWDDDLSQSVNDTLSAQNKLARPEKLHDGSTEGTLFSEGAFSLEIPVTSGNLAQNQDSSSQIPVSEAPLVDVNNGMSQSSRSVIAACPQALSRSPPIESVARSLPRSASYLNQASNKPARELFSKADEEHEQSAFVHKLISSAGVDHKKGITIFGGWHSLDSPLNPSLLYDTSHMEEDEGGKCSERQSIRRLLFDAVNSAILNVSQSAFFAAYPWARPRHEEDATGATVAEQVWTTVRNGLLVDKWVPNGPTNSRIVIERLVKEEVAGGQWAELRWLEVCEFSREIGEKVLGELVEEALSQFPCQRSS